MDGAPPLLNRRGAFDDDSSFSSDSAPPLRARGVIDSDEESDLEPETLQLSDAQIREIHQRSCIEGDGWSHAFNVVYSSDTNHSRQVYSVSKHHDERFARKVLKTHFTEENWLKMGVDISQSTILKTLSLHNISLRGDNVIALFGRRTYRSPPLLDIDLSRNAMSYSDVSNILPSLDPQSRLHSLNLSRTRLCVQGAKLLSEALNLLHIEELDLSNNDIQDEGLEHLLLARNSKFLRKLSLLNNEFHKPGFDTISQFLSNDDTMLTYLAMDRDRIEYDEMIFKSLSKNTTFEYLGGDSSDSLSILPMVTKLVCNRDSFESLCQSNHQVYNLGICRSRLEQSSTTLRRALAINASSQYGAQVTSRLRSKLRAFYFFGDFSVRPFVDMDVKLIPQVLELVTHTEVCARGRYHETRSKNIGCIYHIIRNCHFDLFGFPSPSSRTKELESRVKDLEKKNTELEDEIAMLKSELKKAQTK